MVWQGAWPSHEMNQSKKKLIELRTELNKSDTEMPTEIRAALSRFLIVRACGHVEFTFVEAFCGFTESRSSPMVAKYIRKGFDRGLNPRSWRLIETVERLDSSFSSLFTEYLNEDGKLRKEDLEDLVSLRNAIAHGKREGANTARALKLADFSIELSDWLGNILNPQN